MAFFALYRHIITFFNSPKLLKSQGIRGKIPFFAPGFHKKYLLLVVTYGPATPRRLPEINGRRTLRQIGIIRNNGRG